MKYDIYLCGPMTGIADWNYPAFIEAEQLLIRAGYSVFNPAKNGLHVDEPWGEHMRVDIKHMMDCTALATLPGVEHSKGAQLEIHIAKALGMRIVSVEFWLLAAEEAEANQ